MLLLAASVASSALYLRGGRRQHAAAAAPQSCEPIGRARLLFAGDVMAHLPQLTAARRPDGSCDFFEQFRCIKPRFDAADLVVVNLETTLAPAGPYTGYPCFRTPSSLARALRRAGVDAAVTANNHCCDGGARGIRTTLEALDDAGIRHTGTFVDTLRHGADHPLRLEAGGIRFALFSYTYGTNGLPVPAGTTVNLIDTAAIARDLASVDRLRTDCVIVCLHWGEEYMRHPSREQRRLAAFMRSHGADIVVGSHPHVVQPFECDTTGAVFYSLGNLVSNQRRRYCDGGLLAEVEVVKRPSAGIGGRASMHYAAQAVPVWVALPRYRILPPECCDTVAMTASARAACERFMRDVRELLGSRRTAARPLRQKRPPQSEAAPAEAVALSKSAAQ